VGLPVIADGRVIIERARVLATADHFKGKYITLINVEE